jgi:alkyl sulfatase BDS1-like metallo-beta-lactamase superfamily hydrolase
MPGRRALRTAYQPGPDPLKADEVVELHDSTGKKWFNRYYHGGLHHNVRAVFHKELGSATATRLPSPAAAARDRQAPCPADRPEHDRGRGPRGHRVG